MGQMGHVIVDYGHVMGCYADVTAYVSDTCNYRQNCTLLVARMWTLSVINWPRSLVASSARTARCSSPRWTLSRSRAPKTSSPTCRPTTSASEVRLSAIEKHLHVGGGGYLLTDLLLRRL